MARLTEFERLARALKHLEQMHEQTFQALEQVGPRLLATLTIDRSLRQIAKATSLSPTYLSMIATRKQAISPGAYLLLMDVFNERKGGT